MRPWGSTARPGGVVNGKRARCAGTHARLDRRRDDKSNNRPCRLTTGDGVEFSHLVLVRRATVGSYRDHWTHLERASGARVRLEALLRWPGSCVPWALQSSLCRLLCWPFFACTLLRLAPPWRCCCRLTTREPQEHNKHE